MMNNTTTTPLFSIEGHQHSLDDSTTCLQFYLTCSKKERKDKQIVIVLDISGSMGGEGITQAKNAIANLFKQITDDTQNVMLIAFDDRSETYDLRNKSTDLRIEILNKLEARGGTSFVAAFNAISQLKMFDTSSETAILFFTDGQDGTNEQSRNASIEQLNLVLKSKTKSFEFHTIGFTSNHDVQLLTKITQLGSVQGTFQYVKNGNEINQSMENLIGLLTSNSNIGMLSVRNDKDELLVNSMKILFKSASRSGDGDKEKDDSEEGKYHAVAFLERKGDEKFVKYSMEIENVQVDNIRIIVDDDSDHENENNPILIKMMIKYIEKSLLDITTQVSNNTPKEKISEYFQRGKKLQEKLATITLNIQRMKNRLLRRDLYTFRNTIHETLVRFNEILSSAMIGNFSNDKLATLNDIAYRSITNQCLKKKLDMRKQENASIFQNSELLIEKFVSDLNFEELNEKYKDSIEEYGNCIISCQNWVEALQDRDCLCIALDVNSTEKAIKDPSLVEIKSIRSGTMMTAESFLDSVLFSLENTGDQDGSGGVHTSGQSSQGGAGSNISGVFPLYINEEHWKVAKEKMKSILGYITTSEPLGYMKEQFETIPFLILLKAIEMYQKKLLEFNQLQMILQTSSKILEELNGFESIIEKVLNYNQDLNVRFPDSIPNNQIFLSKVLCATSSGRISLNSLNWKEFFENLMEEELRRMDLERNSFSDSELVEILQLNELIDEQVENFKKKLVEESKKNETENRFISKMKILLESSTQEGSTTASADEKEIQNKENQNNSEKVKKEFETPSSFEVSGKISKLHPIVSNLISKLDEKFRENLLPLINTIEENLKITTTNQKTSDIHSLVKSNSELLCLLIQSCVNLQTPSKRRNAVEKGEYFSPFNEEQSIQFIKSLAQPIGSKKIGSAINQLLKSKASFAGLANQFIYTQDVIEAAGILHGIKKGTTDFQCLIQSFESASEIPLVKEKLSMMLTGYYKNVRLIMDKDGAEWKPKDRFCFRVWKNNKKAFENNEQVISTFGEEYRNYLITVMRIFWK